VANNAVLSIFFTVNLKYILSTQIVEVPYEGEVRKFSVESVSAHHSALTGSVSTITRDLNSLAIQVNPTLWTVGWDTVISILEEVADNDDGLMLKVCFSRPLRIFVTTRARLSSLTLRHYHTHQFLMHTLLWEDLTRQSLRYAIFSRYRSPDQSFLVTLVGRNV